MWGRPQKLSANENLGPPRDDIEALFRDIRARSIALSAPLTAEDQCIQSMADVSPTKWHLAHTSWFFETFILKPFGGGYGEFHPDYGYLFNSYYQAVGPRHERPKRGLLSRPPLEDIHAYRRHVEEAMKRLITEAGDDAWNKITPLIELGLNHEQQHQELILTDIKHVFSCNPLAPAYQALKPPRTDHRIEKAAPVEWIEFPEGLIETGFDGPGFAFDNEGPRHKVWLNGFRIASRPVTNGEFLEFIDDGGYRRPQGWLSEGWATVQADGWEAPLYWQRTEGGWRIMTLAGMRALDPAEPVCHVSFFEADAYANWAGKRLPTEAEWVLLAADCPVEGNFATSGHFHPIPGPAGEDQAVQVFGDVWEWTRSAYSPYPGYKAAAAAIGEYNGKFMSGQMVLKGGSAATPEGHMRASYRNFFYPPDRWQFSGLRLAEDT
jgi:ergothioneine biosynthesis protein EgtB